MLFVFFWVIPRRLIYICRHFGTLYLFHLQRHFTPAFEDGTDRVFRNVGIYKSDAGESPISSCKLQRLANSHLHFLSILEFGYRPNIALAVRSCGLSRGVILQDTYTHPTPRLSDASSSRFTG